MSRRERIIELLSTTEVPLDVGQIAAALGIDARNARMLYEDLEHIARSLKGSGMTLLMVPPTCRACGYVFKDLEKPRRPSRCPRCRSERITTPRFIIRARDG